MIDQNINQKLIRTVTNMITDARYAFYGEFSLYISFKEDKAIPTAGVCIRNMQMMYYYNNDFINKLTDKQMNFVQIHELFHLLCSHSARTKLGGYNHKLSNIVQDMIINSSIVSDFPSNYLEPLKTNGKDDCFFIPKEYTGKPIFEELYEWMKEQEPKIKKKDKKISFKIDKNGKISPDGQPNQGNGQDQEGDGQPDQKSDRGKGGKHDPNGVPENDGVLDPDGVSKYTKHALDHAEDYQFDVHFDSDCSEEIKEQIINDIKNGLKARGVNTNHVDGILNKINPPKKNYLKQIAIAVNQLKGSLKVETITKPSRRGIQGVKGKKLISKSIACILDVSGSMSGHLEKVLSYLYLNDYTVDVVQIDTEVKKHVTTTCRNQIQKMTITGFGGTTLQPAINYIEENLPTHPIILLTDGYTDTLDFSKIKQKVLVISCDAKPNIVENGKTKFINIEK